MKKSDLSQAVILAGGYGRRLLPLTKEIPKPLININGVPFISYILKLLKDQGFREVLILGGYKSENIKKFLKDGIDFGLEIKYSNLSPDFETGKRLFHAKNLIKDIFMLLYCDNYWPLNVNEMRKKFDSTKKLGQITVYSNKDNCTKNNVKHLGNEIVSYDKSRTNPELNGVNIGFSIFQKDVFKYLKGSNVDFESSVFPELISRDLLGFYLTDHRYYSIGSKERLPITENFFRPKKFVFLDRDGVLNEKMPPADYVKNWNEWRWKKGALEGLEKLSYRGYKVIVITNQPGVARKKMTSEDLEYIHSKMLSETRMNGGEIEKIYVCLCGWEVDCDCRKPKPGMLFNAQRDYDLKLESIYFIGDDKRDVEAGKKAGCKTLLFKENDRLDHIVEKLFS